MKNICLRAERFGPSSSCFPFSTVFYNNVMLKRSYWRNRLIFKLFLCLSFFLFPRHCQISKIRIHPSHYIHIRSGNKPSLVLRKIYKVSDSSNKILECCNFLSITIFALRIIFIDVNKLSKSWTAS